MNSALRAASRHDAVLVWSACILALCAGYYVAFGVLGAAVDRQHDRTGRVSAMVLANAEMLAQRPALAREEHIIDERLRSLQLSADKPTTVARFIHVIAQIAAAQHVNLVQIDEWAMPAGPLAQTARPTAEVDNTIVFESIPLDVTLCGTYRALLATIRELAQAPVTMQIEIAAIERTGTTAGAIETGPLSARLHVVLQRLPAAGPLASATNALP